MAEPENFEDDLFADLYEDDTAKPAPPAPEIRSPPAVVNGSSAVRTEESASAEVVTTNEEEYKEEVEQDDDEIDFNLGGGAHDYSAPAHHEREREHGPGIKEDGKMFIGGLNWETTDQSLKDYFSQFGEVLECTVMRDGASGRSRGFGFLTFKDPRTVNVVMVKEHYLDGKIIDPKRAIPRDEQERTSKIFVGGVSQEASEQDFKEYFTQFGRVVDATLMMDKDTGRPRGFGFVTFDSEAAVDACLNIPLEILGKPIEVKKAQPRGNVREEEDRGGRNRFRKTEEQHESFSTQQQSQSNQMAPGGMTPQVMAQYWQRMQQYFAMMQQQMAMGAGRGGAMNPAMNPAMMNPMMMQQMQQMQAMQAMQAAQQQGGGAARSQSPQGPQSPAMNMNPAMMNPMMLQQMQSMQRAQQMGGGATPAPAQGRGTPGYNAYEQQAFEQQKYETQQVRRGRQTSQTPAAGQFGQGAYGANQPTSWEGMYDDVPQPIPSGGGAGAYKGHVRGASAVSGGPQPAPPAGAPTGPKNAGKPGANYRGGGRAGRGGYHPYSR